MRHFVLSLASGLRTITTMYTAYPQSRATTEDIAFLPLGAVLPLRRGVASEVEDVDGGEFVRLGRLAFHASALPSR